MLLVSWNVNGLRSAMRQGFEASVASMQPQILCLQETKLSHDVCPDLALDAYPYRIFHHADKKGYSGTAIISQIEPLSYSLDFPKSAKHPHPSEGRVITAEFQGFTLVNVYVPNSQRGLLRLPYRVNHFDPDFRAYLTHLAQKKPLIVCGDFNVAHTELDLANPSSNRKNAGFTEEERNGFTALLDAGFIDAFRSLNPGRPGQYSWWTYRTNARERSIGWRIDYFLVSQNLKSDIKSALICTNIFGSDHAPVSLELSI
ncbi:MAG: exodeoxyribonuclease III [Verrucomicrobia bacterium CG_4_10_14_3_um_filter_43_23]|nr:MAG: exodeoxyribonuclease III [Verrucomicrobia bacterium CG_4_10_14_3_um_filter_43_23]PIY62506.1 MAG: exodeoxyribonuclease III [Verrucomicrobia bacterium CG_4_10_14_0_8_um_filter_43_34]PJA44674.1 MAG: exodeoxyribonuclease III [Verrucomicrobia bacterium CG_4_9_14_3_um_filter_43_20]